MCFGSSTGPTGSTEDDDLIPDLGGTGTEPGRPGPFPDPRLIPSMHLDVLRLVGQPDERVNALVITSSPATT